MTPQRFFLSLGLAILATVIQNRKGYFGFDNKKINIILILLGSLSISFAFFIMYSSKKMRQSKSNK